MNDELTDERFFAWLDGELAGAEAEEVAALVAADPMLAARAAEHRALGQRLRAAFDPVAAAPVPERLARPLNRSPVRFAGIPQWAAIAATLALGMFLGTMVGDKAGPVEVRGGAVYADGRLDSALDRQLASAPVGGGGVRIGLTFRDSSGAICRSFSEPGSSGLACRDQGGWRLRGLFAPAEGQSGDYRMAAGPDPHLAELIDSTIAGEAFDAAQERQSRERGWR